MTYVNKVLLALIAVAILALMAGAAFAQVVCGPSKNVTAALVQGGNKLAADLQLKTDTGLVPTQIYAHPETKRWVMVLDAPGGNSCAVLIGEGWSPARLPGTGI